jgi:hypothetical protein
VNNIINIKSTRAGFFSNFRGTVSAFKKCESLESIPYVLWHNNIYYDKNYGDNVWDYYFEQPMGNTKIGDETIEQDFSWKSESWTRDEMNRLINKYVKLKPEIINEIDKIYNTDFIGKNVLGVHIRLTDKKTTPSENKTIISCEHYIKEINKYVSKNKNCFIFVATDSDEYIGTLKNEYGDKIILFNDILRGKGNKGVHIDGSPNGYKKGKDVLIETILLSRCNFLIKGISNVSLCSLFFNKGLDSFNVASYYNNDKREDFIKSTKL